MMASSDEKPGQNDHGRVRSGEAWTVLAYMLTGPLVYGGLGWALDQWWYTAFLLLLGLVGGGAASVYLVYIRYVKS